MDLLQQAVIRRTTGEAGFRCFIVVHLPDLLRALDWRVERDIGVTVLRRPEDRLLADDARNPDTRMRLLHRHRPWIDDTMLIMSAFPAERPGSGPRLDDQVVCFFEALTIEGGVDAIGELLLTATAHEARH